MNTDKLTDKIKHMLAIAQDPKASESEREQAMNRAHSLMLKHGIEVALDDKQNTAYDHFSGTLKGVYAEAKGTMMYAILDAYKSFDMILHELAGTSSVAFTIAGPTSQLEEIAVLLNSLVGQSDEERKQFMKMTRGTPRSQQKRMIVSFYMGFGMRVAERIKDILAAEASQRDMKSLVLVRDRATKHLKDIYDVTEKSRRGKKVSSDGFAMGAMAGDRAVLNPQLG